MTLPSPVTYRKTAPSVENSWVVWFGITQSTCELRWVRQGHNHLAQPGIWPGWLSCDSAAARDMPCPWHHPYADDSCASMTLTWPTQPSSTWTCTTLVRGPAAAAAGAQLSRAQKPQGIAEGRLGDQGGSALKCSITCCSCWPTPIWPLVATGRTGAPLIDQMTLWESWMMTWPALVTCRWQGA